MQSAQTCIFDNRLDVGCGFIAILPAHYYKCIKKASTAVYEPFGGFVAASPPPKADQLDLEPVDQLELEPALGGKSVFFLDFLTSTKAWKFCHQDCLE
jgi:hypothetical protein